MLLLQGPSNTCMSSLTKTKGPDGMRRGRASAGVPVACGGASCCSCCARGCVLGGVVRVSMCGPCCCPPSAMVGSPVLVAAGPSPGPRGPRWSARAADEAPASRPPPRLRPVVTSTAAKIAARTAAAMPTAAATWYHLTRCGLRNQGPQHSRPMAALHRPLLLVEPPAAVARGWGAGIPALEGLLLKADTGQGQFRWVEVPSGSCGGVKVLKR